MEALLNNSDTSYGALEGAVDEPRKTSQKSELMFIAKSLGPLIITFILQFLLQTITMFACGHLGAEELAVASLALCSFNITAMAFYQGMSTCLDSFCSQAFGAGRPRLVGVYFQRCSLMMLTFTVFPMFPMWWFSGAILKLLVPSEDLAMLCQAFMRLLALGAPGVLFFEAGKRFFQAQHIFNAGTYALAITVPAHLILNWLLVLHPTMGLGALGAASALSVSNWITCLVLLLYAVFISGKQCWGGLEFRKMVVNWKPMLKLALPGVIMVEADYLAYEVMTIFAAAFGSTALAAQSIGSNVGTIVFQIPFAVSIALSTRIGHFVGVPDISKARLVSKLSLMLGVAMGLFNFTLLSTGRYILARLYTNDKDVIGIASKVIILAAVNQFCDCMNIVAAGILRGQGRQKIGSYINMVAYYIIALPLAYVLAFVADLEVYGLWLGLVCGIAVLALGEVYFAIKADWDRIVVTCRESHDH